MKVVTWGTRGSLPVAGGAFSRYGGNTTCVEILSPCLPQDMAFVIDAGTGFLPCSSAALKREVKHFVMLHTHYHHDHTQGMLIAAPIFIDGLLMDILGPVENGMGPKDVYRTIMAPPLHPVSFLKVEHHLAFHQLEEPTTKVIAVHPEGGMKVFPLPTFKKVEANGRQLSFGSGIRFPIDDCLLVFMHWSQHPERTIAYRMEERPTGKVFVFLTDEEVRSSTPRTLRDFLSAADLVVQDAQYDEKTYTTRTAGFGHGTPGYVVRLATEAGVARVGLTHHDPTHSDDRIDDLVVEGRACVGEMGIEVFACADEQVIEL